MDILHNWSPAKFSKLNFKSMIVLTAVCFSFFGLDVLADSNVHKFLSGLPLEVYQHAVENSNRKLNVATGKYSLSCVQFYRAVHQNKKFTVQ